MDHPMLDRVVRLADAIWRVCLVLRYHEYRLSGLDRLSTVSGSIRNTVDIFSSLLSLVVHRLFHDMYPGINREDPLRGVV